MATIRKLRGRWQAQVRRRGMAPRAKNFDQKADAEKWARSLESELDRRGMLPDTRVAESTTLRSGILTATCMGGIGAVMNRKWIIPLSVAAVAVIAIGAGNYYALSRQAETLGEAIAGKIVAAEGDWRLHKRKDEFSGKESCTIMNAKNPHLWVLDGLMMVRYADRGRLESYVIRVDDRE